MSERHIFLGPRNQYTARLTERLWAGAALGRVIMVQAALIASDLGLPDLAREMCHQHAAAYLHACPLPGMSAIRGLEPVVNLARLHIRAGRADEGRQRLLDLYKAVEAGTAARFEGVNVPADLTTTGEDRQEVRAWLWRVLLADGTRTLTTEGRWAEALAHIEAHMAPENGCSTADRSPYSPLSPRVTPPGQLPSLLTRCPATHGNKTSRHA